MTVENTKIGETPIFTTKAHVFHIDPQTKRSWIPASSAAVNVNFYYDSTRSLYRIISVEGQKPVINSTIIPNMTFTKTSQKFGQWSDIRANTVYGLGFSSEPELNRFIEKFQEVKEATRILQQKAIQQQQQQQQQQQPNGNIANLSSNQHQLQNHSLSARDSPRLSSEYQNDILMSKSLLPHQRSQSLSGLQAKNLTDSPKYNRNRDKQISTVTLPQSSNEAQLRYENERLKLALAQSSTNAKKWEIELQTLKSNNTRLTNALQESTANVEEWKKQLQSLKDENTKMKHKIVELEASHGNPDAIADLRKEINQYRIHCETLEQEIKQKDCEIELLKKRLEDIGQLYGTSNQKVDDKIKILLTDNENLRQQLNRLSTIDNNNPSDSLIKLTDKQYRSLLEQLNIRFAQNIQELRSIQQEFSSLLNAS